MVEAAVVMCSLCTTLYQYELVLRQHVLLARERASLRHHPVPSFIRQHRLEQAVVRYAVVVVARHAGRYVLTVHYSMIRWASE